MHSMTGYGRASAARDGREITVELKSVNHRYLDIGMRLPRQLSFLEDPIRSMLSARLCRGHVDVFLNYRNTRSDAFTVTVNLPLMRAYVDAAKTACKELGLSDDLGLTAALKLPEATELREADEDQGAVIDLLNTALDVAITELTAMRQKEGERLTADLSDRVDTVLALTEQVASRAPLVAEEYRVRLSARIEELLSGVEVDRARLATEVALFADRASIDEEIVRLRSHVAQARLLFADSEPSGRRLDFVVQEMNREFNTVGSKANDGELTNLVLAGKAEIEKIREQVQNIE